MKLKSQNKRRKKRMDGVEDEPSSGWSLGSPHAAWMPDRGPPHQPHMELCERLLPPLPPAAFICV